MEGDGDGNEGREDGNVSRLFGMTMVRSLMSED